MITRKLKRVQTWNSLEAFVLFFVFGNFASLCSSNKMRNNVKRRNDSTSNDTKDQNFSYSSHVTANASLGSDATTRATKSSVQRTLDSTTTEYVGEPLFPAQINTTKLEECQGDCNTDWNCQYGLKCFKRSDYSEIPGCSGMGLFAVDYCFKPFWDNELIIMGFPGSTEAGTPLKFSECQGHCLSDTDCDNSDPKRPLKCLVRTAYEPVTGCIGLGAYKTNYCYNSAFNSTSTASSEAPFLGPSTSPSQSVNGLSTSDSPTDFPSTGPSVNPSISPSYHPSLYPSFNPAGISSVAPSKQPMYNAVSGPGNGPVVSPVSSRTTYPVTVASSSPVESPLHSPALSPFDSTSTTLNPVTQPSTNTAKGPVRIPTAIPVAGSPKTATPTWTDFSSNKVQTNFPSEISEVNEVTSKPSYGEKNVTPQPATDKPTRAPSLSTTSPLLPSTVITPTATPSQNEQLVDIPTSFPNPTPPAVTSLIPSLSTSSALSLTGTGQSSMPSSNQPPQNKTPSQTDSTTVPSWKNGQNGLSDAPSETPTRFYPNINTFTPTPALLPSTSPSWRNSQNALSDLPSSTPTRFYPITSTFAPTPTLVPSFFPSLTDMKVSDVPSKYSFYSDRPTSKQQPHSNKSPSYTDASNVPSWKNTDSMRSDFPSDSPTQDYPITGTVVPTASSSESPTRDYAVVSSLTPTSWSSDSPSRDYTGASTVVTSAMIHFSSDTPTLIPSMQSSPDSMKMYDMPTKSSPYSDLPTLVVTADLTDMEKSDVPSDAPSHAPSTFIIPPTSRDESTSSIVSSPPSLYSSSVDTSLFGNLPTKSPFTWSPSLEPSVTQSVTSYPSTFPIRVPSTNEWKSNQPSYSVTYVSNLPSSTTTKSSRTPNTIFTSSPSSDYPSKAPSSFTGIGDSEKPSESQSSSGCKMSSIQRENAIRDELMTVSSAESLNDSSSMQYKAFEWITNYDILFLCPGDTNLIQRYVLALFRMMSMGDGGILCSGTVVDSLCTIHECLWPGIGCNSNNKVTVLQLDDKNLTGPIPIEFGSLEYLIELDLDSNILTGTIPSELGTLEYLEIVDLDENKLTGTIPEQLFKATSLRVVDLDSNKLSGTIPKQIGNLQDLYFLQLDFNQLSGTIPTELQHLNGSLKYLSLFGNKFESTVPVELCVSNVTNDTGIVALYANCDICGNNVCCSGCYDNQNRR